MAHVDVTPSIFSLVEFDSAQIERLVAEVAQLVGFQDDDLIVISVNELTPLAQVQITSIHPVTLTVESGAFEDQRSPRVLGATAVRSAVVGPLFRSWDRLQPEFADAPHEVALSLEQRSAWDVYAAGRCERIGLSAQRQRRLYAFRVRHGFSDAVTEVFDWLWSARALAWSDILSACEMTRIQQASVPVAVAS
jgi:hypothetical protein